MYSHILYFELNALCILILAFLTYRLSITMYKQKANIDFRNAMLAVMAIMALEIFWSIIDGRPGTIWLVVNYVVDILDFIMCSVVSLLWLKFVVSKLAFKIELQIRGKALTVVAYSCSYRAVAGEHQDGMGILSKRRQHL